MWDIKEQTALVAFTPHASFHRCEPNETGLFWFHNLEVSRALKQHLDLCGKFSLKVSCFKASRSRVTA